MEEPEYDANIIKLFEHVWGKGFLSPGGSGEVDLIVSKANLAGRSMLDLGCGTGGITLHLARHHNLQSVVGFDVETPGHQIAKTQLQNSDIDAETEIQYVLGRPGPLPFENGSFDVVFSKDSLIHVSDLDFTLSEINRVLKPSGVFLGSDWMASQDDDYSPEMRRYLESEGLEFAPKTIHQYKAAMDAAHFIDVEMKNRNDWHKQQVKQEIKHIGKTHHKELVAEFGSEFIAEQLNAWENLSVVADREELYPVHFYCVKNCQLAGNGS